jgi:hypothetical protein
MMTIPINDIRHSSDPDIAGSYYAMQRAGQAAIDLAIQTNTIMQLFFCKWILGYLI